MHDNDHIRQFEEDLKNRQKFLFFAWGFNLFLITVVWLLGFSDDFMKFFASVFEITLTDLHKDWVNWITVWNIAGVVLFLIPAVATYWSRLSLRKPLQ